MDDHISLDAGEATVGEGESPSVAAGANPGDLARALTDWAALTLRDDTETFGARAAGIGECALPVTALATHRRVLQGACDRPRGRAGLFNHDGAGRNDAGEEQEERCGV